VNGNPSPEFIADLKNVKDEAQLAKVEEDLGTHLAAENVRIADAGGMQPPIQMKTVIDPAILKQRQEEEAARAAASATAGAKT
jgi:hypothetical protein